MITGVILARNEEQNIEPCIESFKPHVDELFLIDMESEDRTVEIARPLVDRVLPHKLIPQFDSARNIAIEPASHPWLWFCDADERVSDRVGHAVRDLLTNRGHEFEALSIPFKTYFCGKWIEHCGWWPGFTMPRVMKKGYFRFREELHSGVQVDGCEVRMPADPNYGIDHYSYLSVEHYFEKFNRYTSGEATNLSRQGVSWDWKQATHAMIRDMWMYYERNQGHLDRAHGWILSWLSGQYRWTSHAKLLDENRDNAQQLTSFPKNLDAVIDEMQGELKRLRAGSTKLPLGVVLRTPWQDPSGYADEARCIAKALASGTRDIVLEEIDWSDRRVELSSDDQRLLRALSRGKAPTDAIVITNCIPTLVRPVSGARYNILRTTFETDRIPLEWLPHLNAFDEVWVISKHNERAFIQSGFPPERLRVVASLLDEQAFSPEGETRDLPLKTDAQFVFLSIFDWQLRKGWDLLLAAYVQEFRLDDKTALLLKISRGHGHPMDVVQQQANEVLAEFGTSLSDRPDIVLWDEMLDASELAKLYRSADTFVLPTRGEGWGRPYFEAMASGLPAIGTNGSGNIDFMTSENSLLIPCEEVDVSEAAVREIVTYRGQQWFEPDEESLRQQMRMIREDESQREELAKQALADIRQDFSIAAGGERFEEAIAAVEQIVVPPSPEAAKQDALRVELQGDIFANHSFANINEWLVAEFASEPDVAISMRTRYQGQISNRSERCARVAPFIDRQLAGGPQVTIRHAYPPDWSPVEQGKWVHIQPWEFGHLPVDWIAPLRDRVDEIWAPSNYVRDVFIKSGVPGDKIHVIPWGVDDRYFHGDAPPRFLNTTKSFKFLYVGGTIARKGFDQLLEAYLREFTAEDDVCLVVKDVGHATVYRYGNFREQIFAAQHDPIAPEILYIDDDYTPGQLASLYAACDCLVAPYRGEGFGLPIIEAMACGTAVIVPEGGPTDDFVDDAVGCRIPGSFVETQHPDTLCGPPLELAVEIVDVCAAMRSFVDDPVATARKGQTAAKRVAEGYTWRHSVAHMKSQMELLARTASENDSGSRDQMLPLTVIVQASGSSEDLADCLSRIVLSARQVIVACEKEEGSQEAIAREYGAEVIEGHGDWESDPWSVAQQPNLLVLDSGFRFREPDWKRLEQVSNNGSETTTLTLTDDREITIQSRTTESRDGSLQFFFERFYPHLEKRAESFRFMLEYLERLSHRPVSIVETGCIRMPDDWGAGQSTLIFDAWAGRNESRFLSVDINPTNCEFARKQLVSSMSKVENSDSLVVLQRLATEAKQSIDLLYLDSYDVDWNDPSPSGLHHLKELCAVRSALRPGALVVVDDHRNEQGQLGKSLHVVDFMKSIGAKTAFEGYQIGWFLP